MVCYYCGDDGDADDHAMMIVDAAEDDDDGQVRNVDMTLEDFQHWMQWMLYRHEEYTLYEQVG